MITELVDEKDSHSPGFGLLKYLWDLTEFILFFIIFPFFLSLSFLKQRENAIDN